MTIELATLILMVIAAVGGIVNGVVLLRAWWRL